MLKKLLCVMLAATAVNQGIARANEPARNHEATKADRIAQHEVRGLRSQPGVVPHATPIPWRRVAIIAAVTAGAVVLTSVLLSRRAR